MAMDVAEYHLSGESPQKLSPHRALPQGPGWECQWDASNGPILAVRRGTCPRSHSLGDTGLGPGMALDK